MYLAFKQSLFSFHEQTWVDQPPQRDKEQQKSDHLSLHAACCAGASLGRNASQRLLRADGGVPLFLGARRDRRLGRVLRMLLV
jgi:hypothetical protein